MAEALYMDDSYLKEFDAKVVSVSKGVYVILDRTAFFPQGGGVEWDMGTMRRADGTEFKVIFTGKFEGNISHQVDKEGLKEGDSVHCVLDWERRHKLMRYHTAAHVLSGVFNREYGLMMTGNQLTTEKGRIDMNMPVLDIDKIKEGFAKANDLVQKDLPVDIYYLTKEEAQKDSRLFKLAMGFPHDLERIRIVDIRGYDAQADGGCHVRCLSEIGKITFVEAVNKGKDNRRVYFVVE